MHSVIYKAHRLQPIRSTLGNLIGDYGLIEVLDRLESLVEEQIRLQQKPEAIAHLQQINRAIASALRSAEEMAVECNDFWK